MIVWVLPAQISLCLDVSLHDLDRRDWESKAFEPSSANALVMHDATSTHSIGLFATFTEPDQVPDVVQESTDHNHILRAGILR